MIEFNFSEDGLSACVEGRKKFDDGSIYGTLKVMDGAGELIWAHRGNWADAAVRGAASAKIASISANSVDSIEADLLGSIACLMRSRLKIILFFRLIRLPASLSGRSRLTKLRITDR